MTLYIDDTIQLELTSEKHAQALFEAVDKNRAHLSAFLPWVENMKSVNDFTEYIINCVSLYRQGKEVSFVIILHGIAVGRIGLHHFNMLNKNAEIGYWITKAAEGHGIISKSCKILIAYGFHELNLHRIVIKAATQNVRSQAIPIKLGFKKEGVLRQAEWVNNEFLDIVLFSLLSNEWIEQ